MTIGRRMCMVPLMVLAVTHFVPAQETTGTPPQSSAASQGEGKRRSEEETRKRLERLSCGPSGAHFSHHSEKGPQALPEQPAEKGLVYVLRTKGMEGATVLAKLGMDGKWVGINGMANYFYLEVDPGPHYFCMKAGPFEGLEEPGLLSLVIEKGKTYYLRQNITMGGLDLDLLDEAKGKQYITKYSRSLFEEKQKK